MPKLKTRRGAAKRFKVTASGKFKRRKGFLRHILTSKNRNKKRKLGTAAIVHKSNEKALKKLLPYGC